MKFRMLTLALILAACGGSDDGTADATDVAVTTQPSAEATTQAESTTAPPVATTVEAPAGIAAGGVVIESIDFDTGTMTLRNEGDSDYELAGHWVCNRPSYSDLDALTIAPGSSADVDISAIGLDADDGELGLYTSNDFASPDAIVAYVQWGSADHGRSSVAVDAGVWTEGDALAGGQAVITSSGSSPISAADWTG